MQLLALAFRNFHRHLSRYRVLLLALTLVVAVLTVVVGSVTGMSETLREKASRYFAGDVVVLGYQNGTTSLMEDPEQIERLLDSARLNERARSRRSTYYSEASSVLFHAGYYTRQRRFVGVEWERERVVLDDFDFVAGGVPEEGDREGVLISTAAAESLQARVGDEILVSSDTDQGQANTVDAVVRGIYREPTFFGYTTYLERRTLNELLDRPQEQVNEIGVYLQGGSANEKQAARKVARALSAELPTFSIIEDRDDNSAERGRERERRHYGPITLGAQLAQINDLLEAMTIIAGVIVVMFLLLVVIGVSNTYSMIVYERTREIGTLRALGMQKGSTVLLFVLESLFLAIVGIAAGILLGTGLLQLIYMTVDLSAAPGFASLFLVAGRLEWSLPVSGMVTIAAVTGAAIAAGSLRSAVRAGRVVPVEALRE